MTRFLIIIVGSIMKVPWPTSCRHRFMVYYGTLWYFKQNKLPCRSGKWWQILGWAKKPKLPPKNIISTKSPRNMHNTYFYTNLGVTNPFMMFLWWLRVKKCAKPRWPPRPLTKLCLHQNIVQHLQNTWVLTDFQARDPFLTTIVWSGVSFGVKSKMAAVSRDQTLKEWCKNAKHIFICD